MSQAVESVSELFDEGSQFGVHQESFLREDQFELWSEVSVQVTSEVGEREALLLTELRVGLEECPHEEFVTETRGSEEDKEVLGQLGRGCFELGENGVEGCDFGGEERGF